MKKLNFNHLELAFYYLIIFFILREWLVPILQLTNTGFMNLILLFTAISLVISLFRIHVAVSWVIKLAYIGWFNVTVYSNEFVFSNEGLQFLVNDFFNNLTVIFGGNLIEITDSFRSFLFFILIWMLIYLVHYWITVKMSIFSFLVLTVFFITTLDTFTDYDGTYAIITTIILGLIMMAFLYLKRLMVQSSFSLEGEKNVKLILPVLLFVGGISYVAILLPKSEPQWPDPVPFIKSATGQGETDYQNVISKVGYGENDSRLGGAFVADDQVVFMVEAETKQYWRVETKDVYTSKGWERSDYFSEEFQVFQPGEQILHSLPLGEDKGVSFAYVETTYPYNFIIHPYGLKNVATEHSRVELSIDNNSEKITSYRNGEETVLRNYTVEYSKPTLLYSELKEPTEEIDFAIKERYLQLPETLPDRVVELAQEIVKDEETPYDKAKSIEEYFGRSGFRYDTQDVAIPDDNQDYVDQFLFETKVGYCDNFSTSMVVMLRSIGIPARWVKGFAGGEIVSSEGDFKTFQITNNDAHSWVEAYIPNVGWVNFEPTIGFTNTRSIDYDIETDAQQEEVLTVDEDTEPEEVEETPVEESETSSNGGSNFYENVKILIGKYSFIYMAIIVTILILLILMYKQRRKWLPKVYLKFKGNRPFDEITFEQYYLRLLKVLQWQGLKREDGQTLTSFAREVDQRFESEDMSKLTNAYETFIYSGKTSGIDYDEMRESWEYLINRCSS